MLKQEQISKIVEWCVKKLDCYLPWEEINRKEFVQSCIKDLKITDIQDIWNVAGMCNDMINQHKEDSQTMKF